MNKGGAVLIVICGIAGVVRSVFCILSASIGLRLNEEHAVLIFVIGWVGLFLSFALVVYGSLIFKNSKRLYCLISTALSTVGVVLASIVYIYFVITAPIEETDGHSHGSSLFHPEDIEVFWTAGWFISIYFVLGLVGGVMTLLGIAKDKRVTDEASAE